MNRNHWPTKTPGATLVGVISICCGLLLGCGEKQDSPPEPTAATASPVEQTPLTQPTEPSTQTPPALPGDGNVPVPNLVGMSTEEARRSLQAANLLFQETSRAVSEVPEGQVLSQDPNAGDLVNERDVVNFVVATAPTVHVPNLVGLRAADARAALQSAKLRRGGETQKVVSDVPTGQVVSQDPGADKLVKERDVVTFVIAKAPADCAARSATWKVGSSTCGARYPGGKSGLSVTLTDSVATSTGTATASCTNGAVTTKAVTCVTVPPFSVGSNKSTPLNDDGRGNLVYLDRHTPNCGANAINEFRLTRAGTKNRYQYLYKCTKGGSLRAPAARSTKLDSDGGGNSVFLDRQSVDCGASAVLTKFHLARGSNTVRYDYSCAASKVPLICRNTATGFNDEGGGNTVFLDRHHVRCNANEAISWFRLARSGRGTFRYNYRCCRVK